MIQMKLQIAIIHYNNNIIISLRRSTYREVCELFTHRPTTLKCTRWNIMRSPWSHSFVIIYSCVQVYEISTTTRTAPIVVSCCRQQNNIIFRKGVLVLSFYIIMCTLIFHRLAIRKHTAAVYSNNKHVRFFFFF